MALTTRRLPVPCAVDSSLVPSREVSCNVVCRTCLSVLLAGRFTATVLPSILSCAARAFEANVACASVDFRGRGPAVENRRPLVSLSWRFAGGARFLAFPD